MARLTRSRSSLVTATMGSLIIAAAFLVQAIAFVFFQPHTVLAENNLLIAHSWLWCAGLAALIWAICAAGWTAFLERDWTDVRELGAAAGVTVVAMAGALVGAFSAPQGSQGANVVFAVGVGGWAGVLLVRAARRSLDEWQAPDQPRQAVYWLAASVSVATVAIAAGLPPAWVGDEPLAVTAGVISAVGLVALAVTLVLSRRAGFLESRQTPLVVSSLWTLAGYAVVNVIVVVVTFGPNPSWNGIRVGVPLVDLVAMFGTASLSLAALDRARQLRVVPSKAEAVTPPGWYSPPGRSDIARWWDGARWTSYEYSRTTGWYFTPPSGVETRPAGDVATFGSDAATHS